MRPLYSSRSREARSSRYDCLPSHFATAQSAYTFSGQVPGEERPTEETGKRDIDEDTFVEGFTQYSTNLPICQL